MCKLVSVIVITYQHENYIKDCIEGILIQKTDFPIEIIIHDDASIDGTVDIIKEYEKKDKRIRSILQSTNVRSTGVSIFPKVFAHANGEYIAICEGDDYWTDQYKLKKQVEFLEKNPDYGIVFSDTDHLIESTKSVILSYDQTKRRKIPQGNVVEKILYKNLYKTCTALFRKSVFNNFEEIFNDKTIETRDFAYWLCIAKNGKVGYLSESTAVYRVRERSASHFDSFKEHNLFVKNANRISFFFAQRNNIPINYFKVWYLRILSSSAYIVREKKYISFIKFIFGL